MNWYLAQAEESSNPLRLPLDEIIIGLLAFFIVFGVLGKLMLPRIAKVLDDRADAIEGGIERSRAAEQQAQEALEQYRSQLADARGEASRIRTEAQSERKAIIDRARDEAQQAADAEGARARARLDADVAQVRGDLQRQVGGLAMSLAEKIVGESLDESRVRGTVDRFLDDLDGMDARVPAGERRA